jgi:CDP-diacylglycerol---glycerol-3-phosphate 3-phosphatidyltransferase
VKIPNLLTLSRLVMAPLFLLAFLGADHGGYGDTPAGAWAALGLAIYFELTDMVDGAVARHLEQTSQLGKILDPLADSISRFTIFLAFLVEGFASPWAIAFIFYRDGIVSTIRVLAASQGVIVSARWSGKLKAVVQGTAIITIVAMNTSPATYGLADAAGGNGPLKDELAWPVMWLVAGVTLLSLFDYLFGNRKVLAKLDR